MSPDVARLSVGTPLPSAELTVLDGRFTEVARGIGRLDTELRPGIYEVRAAAGPASASRLVRLEAGATHRESLELGYPSAAPVPGTTTWNPEHAQAVAEAIGELAFRSAGHVGGLIVMVRALATRPEGDPHDDLALIGDVRDVETRLGPDWQIVSALAPTGGCALRARRDGIALEQSLWVQSGWQTLVFLSAGERGPNLATASVWMWDTEMSWDWMDSDTAAAYELALWGVRDGRSVLPPDFLDLLLYGKFRNPMLGVLGAHALLLEPEVDLRRFDVVVGNLDQLLPDAPDVAALSAMGEQARVRRHAPPRGTAPADLRISWPPMLTAAHLAALRLDARRLGDVIQPGSVADRIGARLTGTGVWTTWTAEARPARARRATHDVEDAETARVLDYVAAVADARGTAGLSEVAIDLDPVRVAAATGLPYRAALSALGALIHPPDA